jgi:hypothetical protein
MNSAWARQDYPPRVEIWLVNEKMKTGTIPRCIVLMLRIVGSPHLVDDGIANIID